MFWIPLPVANIYSLILVFCASGGYLAVSSADGLRHLPSRFRSFVYPRVRASFAVSCLMALVGVGLEASVSLANPAGNTLDGANAVLLTSNLLYHGHFTATLAPYVAYPAYSPQGFIVWFASAHLLLGLPLWASPNETAPLFLGLTILAASYLGRKWLDRAPEWGAVGMAFVFTFLLSWPRMLVQGTYDFVAAFPLLLLLVAEFPSSISTRKGPLNEGRSLLFLLTLTLCTTMSPIPAEVMVTSAMVLLVLSPLAGKDARRYWRDRALFGLSTIVAALVGALPSLVTLMRYPVTGARAPVTPSALTPRDLVALLNPFAFGTGNIWVSPIPVLHGEIAILLVGGVALALLGTKAWALVSDAEVQRLVLGAASGLVGAAALVVATNATLGGALSDVANISETTLVFVTAEGIVGGWCLGVLLRSMRLSLSQADAKDPPHVPAPKRSFSAVLVATFLVVVMIVPVVESAQAVPSEMNSSAFRVSNVTDADIAALNFLAGEPTGAVLVAPGSAANFLPAFVPDPLIFPLVGIGGGVGFLAGNMGPGGVPFSGPVSNLTYQTVIEELTTGNMTSALPSQLSALNVRYVVVTGESTTLFSPFLPGPLLSDPSEFRLIFSQGDAYVFSVGVQSSFS